jgi:hypothetical protein
MYAFGYQDVIKRPKHLFKTFEMECERLIRLRNSKRIKKVINWYALSESYNEESSFIRKSLNFQNFNKKLTSLTKLKKIKNIKLFRNHSLESKLKSEMCNLQYSLSKNKIIHSCDFR